MKTAWEYVKGLLRWSWDNLLVLGFWGCLIASSAWTGDLQDGSQIKAAVLSLSFLMIALYAGIGNILMNEQKKARRREELMERNFNRLWQNEKVKQKSQQEDSQRKILES